MTEKTAVEKISSSLPANLGANTVAALGATITPLAAFVPFLVQSLASGRQSKRLEAMFADLNSILEEQAERIQTLSDDQYKVVNEAISAAFYTINDEKLRILKNAISATIKEPDTTRSAADALSRAIRDISAEEAKFLVENFKYPRIYIDAEIENDRPDSLVIRPNSSEEILASGLISLGLLYTRSSSWDASMYEWSPLVAKLIVLLTKT